MRPHRWLVALAILAGCGPGPGPGLRIPAEWEEQEAVWLSWTGDGDENNLVLAAIIRELQGSVKVKVVFSSEPARRRSFRALHDLAVDTQAIEAHVFPGADTWIRDQGAVFAFDGPGRLAALDLGWSQYGQVDWSYARWPEWFEGRYDSVKTSVERSPGSRVDSLMGAAVKARHHKVNVILEGGSFEY
ncbi:MAG: agmatine deiminase family protein, partial [Flavobacteriales bacterium]|nr:agmatine deiminase family protein [Flavobacteriales bacterium]